jgi:hypothetical protein
MSIITTDTYRIIDPVLTTLAQGYQNATMVADALFPVVQVASAKGKIPKFNKTAFIYRDTNRALGARSNRINDLEYQLIDYETIENDVEMAVDYLEEEGGEYYIKLEQKMMRDLLDILAVGKERAVADEVQRSQNYTTNTSTNCEDSIWSDSDSDPISIVKSSIEKLRKQIGRQPNTAIIGASTYNALLNHKDIIDRVKFSGVRRVNTAVLSELFEVPIIRVGYGQHTEDNVTFKDIWRDVIVLAFVNENEKGKRSQYNPSYGYTIQKRGCPEIDSYYENGGKVKVIRATDNYAIKVTCVDAAHLIYNCLTPSN